MSARIAFPFLTLSDVAVEATPWMIQLNENTAVPAGEYLSDWDYASKISIHRSIALNWDLASSDLDIPKEYLRLALGFKAGSGPGRLPRAILKRSLQTISTGSERLDLAFEIPSSSLSSTLDLITELIVEVIPEKCGPLSPTSICERVWQDVHRLRLEGEEPRFPIEVVNLAAILEDGIASAAPWYVHWTPGDWSREFHGSMRLYINKSHPDFVDRVHKGDPETLRSILADVMGQICERFLSEDLDVLSNSFETGTLGAQAVAWIKAAWPTRDMKSVQDIPRLHPGKFRAAMLGLAEQRGIQE